MSKLKNMRVIEIPKFRAISSGPRTLDEIFSTGGFDEWCGAHEELLFHALCEPVDFLWHENNDINHSVLIKALKEGVTKQQTTPWEIINFPGGIFLVATADETSMDDINETVSGMLEWIADSGVFEYGDFPESGMCNMPGNRKIDSALRIAQQQIFLPLKLVEK